MKSYSHKEYVMPVRARGNSWQVDVRKKGIRFRHTYQTEDQANVMLAKVEEAISLGKALPDPEDCNDGKAMTIAALLRKAGEKYWSDTQHGVHSLQVIETMIEKNIGENRHLSELNLELMDELIAYWKSNGNSAGTINRKLSVLSKATTYAVDRGYIDQKPKIEWQTEGKGRMRFVSQEEEAIMCRVLTQMGYFKERDVFMFLIDTGMRVGELNKLRLDDLQGNKLTIWETKADHPRTVVLTKRAKDIFKNNKGNLYIPYKTLIRHWHQMKGAMGLDDDKQFIPHCLRHTCASRLVQRGVPILVVQEWLGHKTIQMTMRYSHLCPTNLEEAVKVLEPTVAQAVA
jgi:integrase